MTEHAKRRLPYEELAADGFKRLLNAKASFSKSGLSDDFVELLYLRVSQINGCAYCVDLHFQKLRDAGVNARKINSVCVWSESTLFTEAERSALAWCEAVTHIKDQAKLDSAFDWVSANFTATEVAYITQAVGIMGALNRMAISFQQEIT